MTQTAHLDGWEGLLSPQTLSLLRGSGLAISMSLLPLTTLLKRLLCTPEERAPGLLIVQPAPFLSQNIFFTWKTIKIQKCKYIFKKTVSFYIFLRNKGLHFWKFCDSFSVMIFFLRKGENGTLMLLCSLPNNNNNNIEYFDPCFLFKISFVWIEVL